jgi:universal stress protein A
MKIKPTHKRGGVTVELGPNEARLPADTLFRLKRILVPVDFSDCSKKALAYALPFAKQFDAEIVLTHVVQPFVPVPEMSSVDITAAMAQMRESGKSELERLRVSITDDVKITTVLRVGHPAHEIVKTAAEADADLILLSTHGRTGLGRVFFGSVAEHVTRYARCPVLAVREREHEFVDVATPSQGAKVPKTAVSPALEAALAL